MNAYKALNITHWGLTVQNEPLLYWSLYYTPEMMRDFVVKTLGPELKRSGWGTDKLQLMTWDFNVHNALDWVKTVFADKTYSKYVAGIAVHWYERKPETWEEMHKLQPDKFILSTEACTPVKKGIKIGAWSSAEDYAQDILEV